MLASWPDFIPWTLIAGQKGPLWPYFLQISTWTVSTYKGYKKHSLIVTLNPSYNSASSIRCNIFLELIMRRPRSFIAAEL